MRVKVIVHPVMDWRSVQGVRYTLAGYTVYPAFAQQLEQGLATL